MDEQLSRLPASATVGLFRFDDRWSAVAGFAELKRLGTDERRKLIQARLGDMQPGWRGTNLGEALVRTAAALQETQTERSVPARLRIVLASDLQSGATLDALNGFEWPGDLRLQLLAARPASPSNAGLQWVDRNLDMPDDLQRVKVSNAADSRREQFRLTWDGPKSDAVAVYVPPGQSRVVVAPKRPANDMVTSLKLTGDDDDFDNTLHLAPWREETRLIVFVGTDSADDPMGLRFYLEGVYGASPRYRIDFGGWQDSLTASRAKRPALVVLADAVPDAGDFVTTHLAQGGTILVTAHSADTLTRLLTQCGLDGMAVTESARRDSMLGDIDFEHPLFAPFAESQFSDFTAIRFWKHRTVAGFPVAAARTPHDGRVLARFDDGDPALLEFKAGRGTVWVLTGGWHPADSQLARSSKFPPLMYRMLEQASGTTVRPQSVAVGQPIAWPAAPENTSAKGIVRPPEGSPVADLPLDVPFTATDVPGVYSLDAGNGAPELVAVNLDADESRTAPLPLEQLEGQGVRLGTSPTPQEDRRIRERERQLQIEELEQTQKLWRWGLLGAIGLLLAETWLAGRRRVESSTETQDSVNADSSAT